MEKPSFDSMMMDVFILLVGAIEWYRRWPDNKGSSPEYVKEVHPAVGVKLGEAIQTIRTIAHEFEIKLEDSDEKA